MTRVSQTGASFWYRNLDFDLFRYQNWGRERASRADPEAPDRHRTNHCRDGERRRRQSTMTKRGEPGTCYQGYDNRGREIELIVVEGEDYDLVVHAMPVDYRRRK